MKKTALHLLDTLRFGGAENVALNYTRSMNGWGVVSTLCGRKDSPEFERSAAETTAVHRGFPFWLLRKADCVFVHSNRNLLKLFLLRPFLRLQGKEVVYIQHLEYSERKFRWLAPIIHRVCTGFIRITPITEKLVGKYIRIPAAFIPNFYTPRYDKAEHPALRSAVREESGIREDQILILFTGALKAGKGLADFLALADRFAEDDRCVFVVAGDGQEARLIREKERENLRWLGWQADVERWLIASDAYCFLSGREMMPLALIEALALGKPVLAVESSLNDLLTGGKTFSGIDDMERAIRAGKIPVCPLRYDKAYAEKELRNLLNIDRKRKILHIQVLPKMTGVQRVSLEILRALPDTEYEKTILFGGPENPHTEHCARQFREAGARVVFLPCLRREIGRRDAKAFREIYRLCRRERYDIVHTHSTKPGVVGRVSARLARVPLVVHTVHGVAFHAYEKPWRRRLYYAVEQFASLFSHRIVLVSAYYRKHYRRFRKRLRVIHNGLDFSRFPAVEPETPDGNTFRLLFVGRLTGAKEPLTLLRAMKLLTQEYGRNEFRLTVVGDGELEAACREFVRLNGLENRVVFAGWQPDPTPFYGEHELFCLSSVFEAFGLSLLEAGYYGLPVVATRVGGIPEVVEDGVTGFLTPPGDPRALAQRVLELAGDPALRNRMGRAARERAEKYFAAERMTEGYKRIYNGEIR